MGMLKRFLEIKEQKESDAISSNLYYEELRQIEENYNQGFIRQERQDSQFFLYTKWGKSFHHLCYTYKKTLFHL